MLKIKTLDVSETLDEIGANYPPNRSVCFATTGCDSIYELESCPIGNDICTLGGCANFDVLDELDSMWEEEMNLCEVVCFNIHHLTSQKGWTIEEMLERSGLVALKRNKILTKKECEDMTLFELDKIAKAFDISVSSLMSDYLVRFFEEGGEIYE